MIDNQDENKNNNKRDEENKKNEDNNKINKVKEKENKINKEKENKMNKVKEKENKEKENKEKEIIKIKENSTKLILVKIFIGIIFFLLSVIIVLFVRIKSLQRKKASYIELAGLDSI